MISVKAFISFTFFGGAIAVRDFPLSADEQFYAYILMGFFFAADAMHEYAGAP
jgi:hypothetical protein